MLITGDLGYIGTHLRTLFPDAEACDIKRDRNEDYRNIWGREFDVVVHLAAYVSVPDSFLSPVAYFHNNAIGLAKLLSANTVHRIVFLSTCALYGNNHDAEEQDADWKHCLSPYAQSKFLGETVVNNYHKSHVILRLGNVYGGDYSMRSEAAVHVNFESANPIVVYGGDQTRDFVHVGAVCDAIKAAAEGTMAGCFNIGSGRESRIGNLAESYAKLRSVPVEYLPKREHETDYIRLNLDRAKKAGLLPERF